jgi:hypothetical protein
VVVLAAYRRHATGSIGCDVVDDERASNDDGASYTGPGNQCTRSGGSGTGPIAISATNKAGTPVVPAFSYF